jgi:hypothetical protein
VNELRVIEHPPYTKTARSAVRPALARLSAF